MYPMLLSCRRIPAAPKTCIPGVGAVTSVWRCSSSGPHTTPEHQSR
jgi:hypothetical protein